MMNVSGKGLLELPTAITSLGYMTISCTTPGGSSVNRIGVEDLHTGNFESSDQRTPTYRLSTSRSSS